MENNIKVEGSLTDRNKLDLFGEISKLIKEYDSYKQAKQKIELVKMLIDDNDPDIEILYQLEMQNEEQGYLTYITPDTNKDVTIEYKNGVMEGLITHHEGLEPIYINKWDALKAAMHSNDAKECEESYNLLCKMFSTGNDPVYNGICSNIEEYFAMYDFIWNKENEFYYQDLFKKHYKSFLPLAELVKRKNNPKHHPDAWLKENGEYIPVEVKLEKFDEKALKQLKRYMEFYDCKNGVAVGDKLTVELPDNIQFVNNKDLESLNK